MIAVTSSEDIGNHRLELRGTNICVVTFNGDINEREASRINELTQPITRNNKRVYFVVEMSRMGKFSPEARKVFSANTTPSEAHSIICMVKASVVTRAALALVTTAASVANKTRLESKSFGSMEEALAFVEANERVAS